MDDLDKRLISLYKKMYKLTRPKCGKCNCPLSCCSPEYCDEAIRWAKEKWKVELEPTEYNRFPLMGPMGCIADPHLRPMCTLHVCENWHWRDPVFSEAYFELREELNAAEYEKEIRE